jgi:soluble lytic murein transglycosylase
MAAAPAAIAAIATGGSGLAVAKTPPASSVEIAAVKRAVELVRGRKQTEAATMRDTISDPVSRTLIEWVILRSDDAGASFARFAEFIAANPGWPSIVTLRRKAESMAFNERPDPNAVRRFFSVNAPLSARGKIAFARALKAVGQHGEANALARETWRQDSMSADMEQRLLDEFGSSITRADHKARMDRRLYEADDTEAGLRAANRLGGHEPAIAKARIALLKNANRAAVDAVPAAARDDVGYKFARLQMLRRTDKLKDAVALLRTVPKLDDSHDLDEWWVERRLLVRRLLDDDDPKSAYAVARDATTPSRDNYRAEQQFTAGWVALRYLNDPQTAYAHFSKVPEGQQSPISISRGYYWMGRAMEAMRRPQEARALYERAARHPTAYYGQLARAKAGLGELALPPTPRLTMDQRLRAGRLEVVRAASILYAIDARDMVHPFLADLGDKSDDVPGLIALTELAEKNKDARGAMLVGKLALSRGLPLDQVAFPTYGVPAYKPIAPEVEPAIVHAIARQESWFNPRTISRANAMGLMQVLPSTARGLAKKHNVPFDQKRLLDDPVYNVQIGAAELAGVVGDHRGSYILAFVAYNAGRGRARDWIARFGDPRDPKVDPIDWVERIPFAETRNYVQRVMENVQVYRARFGNSQKLMIEADLRRGAAN